MALTGLDRIRRGFVLGRVIADRVPLFGEWVPDGGIGCWSLFDVLCESLFFFQAEDGIRDLTVTGVQTCALPIFRHHILLAKVAQRVNDPDVLHGLKLMLKASGTKGVAQGGVLSPLLSNLYLTAVEDRKSVV